MAIRPENPCYRQVTQGKVAALMSQLRPFKKAVNENRASVKDRADYCAMLLVGIEILASQQKALALTREQIDRMLALAAER